MKKLKRIDDYLINEIDKEFKSSIVAGKLDGDTVMGCVEYTQVNAGTGDMHQVVQKDDGTVTSDTTVYYPTWPL